MSIEEKLRIVAERIKSHSSAMLTEEAVKTAVVLPFLAALDYDVFNFHTDLEAPNKLDDRPFFTFDPADIQSHFLVELRKFSKDEFSVDAILQSAHRLKYISVIKKNHDSDGYAERRVRSNDDNSACARTIYCGHSRTIHANGKIRIPRDHPLDERPRRYGGHRLGAAGR